MLWAELLVAMCAVGVSLGWGGLGGGGSERMQERDALKAMVEDKEHIEHELDGMLSERQLNALNGDELAFTWFSVHDADANGDLDGLEVFKAITHASQDHEHQAGVSYEAAEALVDDLLKHDANMDGFLDPSEFMNSFGEYKEALKV